jgi:hypothetical protein
LLPVSFVFLQKISYHYAESDRKVAQKLPKRTDLKSILIIGSGLIIIGQACEFDYLGMRACKVLSKAEFLKG